MAADTRTTPPWVCNHAHAEHTSRYDLRCVHCGQRALESEHHDDLMLELWIAWARENSNDGAAYLFERIQYRLKRAAAARVKALLAKEPA